MCTINLFSLIKLHNFSYGKFKDKDPEHVKIFSAHGPKDNTPTPNSEE